MYMILLPFLSFNDIIEKSSSMRHLVFIGTTSQAPDFHTKIIVSMFFEFCKTRSRLQFWKRGGVTFILEVKF
jgi:hypothetical protein